MRVETESEGKRIKLSGESAGKRHGGMESHASYQGNIADTHDYVERIQGR